MSNRKHTTRSSSQKRTIGRDDLTRIQASVVSHANRMEMVKDRTDALLALYDGLSHDQGEDLLRAVVVWLHGALEETLRYHVAVALINGDRTALDRVPLAGSRSGLRAEKFHLGALALFRDQSVANVIVESVEEYVSRLTFNDFSDVAGVLDLFDLSNERLIQLKQQDMVDTLNALFERRHKIVHEGDLVGVINPTLRPLSKETVVQWQKVTVSYLMSLFLLIEVTRVEKENGPEWIEDVRKRAELVVCSQDTGDPTVPNQEGPIEQVNPVDEKT